MSRLSTVLLALASTAAVVGIAVLPANASVPFRRGDANQDGAVSLTDAVAILGHLFAGGAGGAGGVGDAGSSNAADCPDALDIDDSGALDLTDAVVLLRHLFLGGTEPEAPFRACGLDPTDDALGCTEFPICSRVFDATALHEISLVVSDADLQLLQKPPSFDWPMPQEPVVRCQLTFDGLQVADVGLKRKGNSTLYMARNGKYSFSVRLDEFVEGQRLHGLEKLILNSCALDPTFLDEVIGYGIYRRMGLPASLVAHATVTLNDRPMGIYLVKEAVDVAFLERNFGRRHASGNLYEGPGDFLPRDPNFPEETLFEPALVNEGGGRTRDDFNVLRDALAAASMQDLLRIAAERLDLPGFVTGWAVDATVLHFDGYPGNYYLYDNPRDSRFAFIPHGMDQLFGWREFPRPDPDTGEIPPVAPTIQYLPQDDPFVLSKGGALAVRMTEIPEGVAWFREEVVRVARVGWDVPAILGQIDRLERLVATLSPPGGSLLADDIDVFSRNVGPLRAYVLARKAYLGTLRP